MDLLINERRAVIPWQPYVVLEDVIESDEGLDLLPVA